MTVPETWIIEVRDELGIAHRFPADKPALVLGLDRPSVVAAGEVGEVDARLDRRVEASRPPPGRERGFEPGQVMRGDLLVPEGAESSPRPAVLFLSRMAGEDRYGFAEPNRELHEILQEKKIAHVWRLVEGGNHGYFSADGSRSWRADQRPGQFQPFLLQTTSWRARTKRLVQGAGAKAYVSLTYTTFTGTIWCKIPF